MNLTRRAFVGIASAAVAGTNLLADSPETRTIYLYEVTCTRCRKKYTATPDSPRYPYPAGGCSCGSSDSTAKYVLCVVPKVSDIRKATKNVDLCVKEQIKNLPVPDQRQALGEMIQSLRDTLHDTYCAQ